MIGNSETAPGTEPITLLVETKLAEKENFDLSGEHLFEKNYRRLLRATVLEDEVPSSQLVELDVEDTSQTVEESLEVGKESHRSKKVKPKGKKVAVAKETAEEPSATNQGSKGKTIMPQYSKSNKTTNRGPGASSMISSLIEAQRRGTEEIDRLTLLLAPKEADLALLKAKQSSQGIGGEPGAVLELQNTNVMLKAKNTALKKQLEDLTQQMLHDQCAANERIDKLLSEL
ncbi:hypothetical protein HAX54_031226 [Datura stramonium]|uniref:Uncharacterized protein n=1 Tax=Datura stramonium TaxID=4076 RepID=A0ABS8SCK9_DATST|nr:hypothetical protein [Datura stramonium]